jgi:prepilin-type N-terminal cleavage/methylation domain-containing protein
MRKKNPTNGMTLVELMIAMAIGVMVLAVALRFVNQNLRTYQYETGKLLVNRDIRKFTTQMVDDGTYANKFYIYDQCSNLSRTSYTAVGSTDPTSATYKGYTTDLSTTSPDDPVTSTGPGTEAVDSGLPGDVLVWVYYVDGDNSKIQQLIIYYRLIDTPAGGSTGANSTTVTVRTAPLKRLVVKIPASVQSAGILKLLPELTATTPGTPIFSFVDGQANDVVPTGSVNRINKMFYNSNNNSVLVRGRIYENYTAQRLIKSTYNFTITPRG